MIKNKLNLQEITALTMPLTRILRDQFFKYHEFLEEQQHDFSSKDFIDIVSASLGLCLSDLFREALPDDKYKKEYLDIMIKNLSKFVFEDNIK